MKLFLCFIYLFFINFTSVNSSSLNLNSEYVLLMECESGKILYQSNMDVRNPMASMTKMMGMYLILEKINLGVISYDDQVTASKLASSYGGSQIYLKENEVMSVRDLFKSVCIASSNDALVALGEYSYGSLTSFIEAMNQKATAFNLKNTSFINAVGFDDENHYSSCFDMGTIARRLLLDYPEVLDYTSIKEDYIRQDSNPFWLVNTNKMMSSYQGMDGLKTGYTTKAKYNLTATASRNQIRLIGVVMKEESIKNRTSDMSTLLDYGFSLLKKATFYEKNQLISQIQIEEKLVNLYLQDKASITILKTLDENKATKEIILLDYTLPLKASDIIGYLKITLDEEEYLFSLIIQEDVHQVTYFYRLIKNILKMFC